MNYRIMMVLIVFTTVISSGYKLTRNRIEEYRHKIISDQVCHVSEARLQVGSTREVVDVAKAALTATGHPEAELTLKVGGQVFTESELEPRIGVFKPELLNPNI